MDEIFWFTINAKGMRDGRAGLPREDHYRTHVPTNGNTSRVGKESRLSYYELQMFDAANAKIGKVVEAWRSSKEELEGQCKFARYQLIETFQAAKALIDEKHVHGFHAPYVQMGMFWYGACMAFTAAAELAFNFGIFRVLRMTDTQVFLISVGPSAAIVAAAHLLGKSMKQSSKDAAESKRSRLAVICAVSAFGVALGSTALLRYEHVAQVKNLPSLTMQLGLAGLNVAMFLGGTIASYLSHATSESAEETWTKSQQFAKRLRKSWNKWNSLSGRYDRQCAVAQQKVKAIYDETFMQVDEYRRGVAATRLGTLPSWFNDPLSDHFFRPLDAQLFAPLDGPPGPIDAQLKDLEAALLSKRTMSQTAANGIHNLPVINRNGLHATVGNNGNSGHNGNGNNGNHGNGNPI